MSGPSPRSGLRRFAVNSLSLVSSSFAIRASSFLVYVLVARTRGAFEFGQLSLAATVFAILLELALLGVRRVVTREVALDPSISRAHLVDAGALTLVGTVAALAVATGFVRAMGYEPETASLILLFAVGLWPAAVAQVTESIAQGWERMHLMLSVNGPLSIAKVAAVAIVLQQGLGVVAVAWVFIASHLLGAAIASAVIAVRSPPGRAAPRASTMLRLAREGAPFLGINLAAAIRSNIATVFVSGFLGETSVGLFNAAKQLTVPIRLVYENLVASFFPAMVRRFRAGAASLRAIVGTLIGGLTAFTLPTIVALFVLAEPVLVFLYREPAFADAAVVLMITVWATALDTLKGVLGNALWAGHHERLVLRVTIVNVIVSIVAGLALIPAFELIGAAVSLLTVAAVNVLQHAIAARSALGAVPLLGPVWRPAVASAAMAAALVVALPLGAWLAVTLSVLLYLVVLGGLLVWSVGGLAGLRTGGLARWLG